MNLNQEKLLVISDCILSKIEELSKVKNVSTELWDSIYSEIEVLQKLNSKVCEELTEETEQKDHH